MNDSRSAGMSSVLDLVFYDGEQFPPEYRGHAFVALKGSWTLSRPAIKLLGYGSKTANRAEATRMPSGSEWLHEIKHDGFRVIAGKNGAQVKVYSRVGAESMEDTRPRQTYDRANRRKARTNFGV